MATEFNPGGPIEKDAAARNAINPPAQAHEARNWGMTIAVAAIALLIVVGLVFSMRGTHTATNVSPGSTTGASPSNPPAAPGPKGQGESNSTR